MKQQDIAILIVVVFVATVSSFIVVNQFISPSTKRLSAPVVKPIVPDFVLPDKSVFNGEAINPAASIQIAPNENSNPFQNQGQ